MYLTISITIPDFHYWKEKNLLLTFIQMFYCRKWVNINDTGMIFKLQSKCISATTKIFNVRNTALTPNQYSSHNILLKIYSTKQILLEKYYSFSFPVRLSVDTLVNCL